ncbi:MAG: hypothetical protein ACOYW7_08380 [Nitrospirota bacterium]
MRITKLLIVAIAVVAIGLIGLSAEIAGAATLKDADGNGIQPGTSTPYSPKQTCGNCHVAGRPYDKWTVLWDTMNLTGTGRYEMDVELVTKSHSGETYQVPAPKHGISAGYHFQQGRNVAWGNTQRNFYSLPGFTSSPGMYGKF